MRSRALVWFGLFGAPAAWTVQHVTGYALTEASCHEAGAGWSLDLWTTVVTAAAALVAVLAGVAGVAAWRATRGAGSEPPEARVRFLATMTLAITPLFLMIILMSGLGSIFLSDCVQS